MSISSNYLANSTGDGENVLKNVRVSVKSDKAVSQQEVQSVVQKAIAQQGIQVQKVNSISIHFEEGRTTFTINGMETKHQIGEPDQDGNVVIAPRNPINLKMVNISKNVLKENSPSQVLASRTQTLKETYRSLCHSANEKMPNAPLRFIATTVLAPVALITFIISPKIKATTSLPQAEDKNAMSKLLKAHQEIFDIPPSSDPNVEKYGEEFGIHHQMEEALALSKLTDPAIIQSEAKAFAGKIQTRLETANAKNAGQVNLGIIPAGYWKNGVYQPAFIAFYKNSEGHLCATQFSFGDKQGIYGRDFIFKNNSGESLNQLTAIVTYFMQESASEQPNQSLVTDGKNAKKSEFLLKAQSENAELQNVKQEPEDLNNPDVIEEFREKVMVASGGQILENPREEKRTHVRSDPWKLLHEVIATQFPDTPAADKTLFVMGVLNNKLQKVINDWDGLTAKEKKEWAQKLDAEYMHIVRQVNVQGFKESDLSNVDLFLNLKKNIEELNKKANVIHGRDSEIEAREKVFDKVKITPSILTVSAEATSDIAIANKPVKNDRDKDAFEIRKSEFQLTDKDVQEAHSLGIALKGPFDTKEKIEKLQKGLSDFAVKLDKLVAEGRHDEVKALYNMVVGNLPTPGSIVDIKTQSLWGALKLNPELIGTFSRSLSSLNKSLWESKIKTWDVPLAGRDWANMQNLEFGLVHLAEISRENIIEKARAAGVQVPGGDIQWSKEVVDSLKRAGLSFDEICLLGKAGKLNKTYAKEALQKFSLFKNNRPGLDIEADNKIQALRQFVKDRHPEVILDKIDGKKDPELEIGNIVSAESEQIWEMFHGTPQSLGGLQLSYGSDPGPHLPSLFVDFSRAQVMRNILLFPDSSIFKSTPQKLSNEIDSKSRAGKFSDHASQIIPDNIVSNEMTKRYLKKDQNYQQKYVSDYRNELLDMDRLDLVAISLPGKYGNNVLLGIAGSADQQPKLMVSRDGAFNLHFHGYEYPATLKTEYNSPANELGIKKSPVEDLVHSNVVFDAHEHSYAEVTEDELLGKKWVYVGQVAESNKMNEAINVANGDHNTEKLSSMELYALSSMDIRGGVDSLNVSTVSAINAFQYILQNPDKLNNPMVRARIISVLGHQGLLKKLAEESPQVFLQISAMLKEETDRAFQRKELGRFSFLLQVGSFVSAHVEQMPTKQIYQQIISNLPTFMNVYNVDDKPMKGWELILQYAGEKNTQKMIKMDCYAAVLHFFASSSQSNLSELIKTEPKLIGALLAISEKLKGDRNSCSVPAFAEVGIHWVLDKLSPEIFSDSTDSNARNKVLNAWMFEQTRRNENVNWVKGVGPKEGLWIGGTNEINPAQTRITKVQGKEFSSTLPSIPEDIRKNVLYKKLFGERIYQAETLELEGNKDSRVTRYNFKDDTGASYRIVEVEKPMVIGTELITKTTVYIERLFPKGYAGSSEAKWFRYAFNPNEIDKGGLEKIFSQRGIWIDLKNPKQAMGVAQELDKAVEKDIYTLEIEKGKVTSIHQGDKVVVLDDASAKLENTLGPINSLDLIYLTDPKSKTINEIRLNGQGITLKRENEGSHWIVQEGPYAGFEVRLEGKGVEEVKHLLGFMGSNFEQFGLVLVHPETNEKKILLWPNKILSKSPEKALPDAILEFEKNPLEKPMVLSLGGDKRWHGDPEALLYIAYLATAKHEYAHAKSLLSMVKREAGGNPETLRKVEEFLLNLPGSSRRLIALRLKGVLQVEGILRQLNVGLLKEKLDDEQMANRLNRLQKIGALAKTYEEFAKVPKMTLDEAELSTEELSEIKSLGKQGFSDIIQRTNPALLTSSKVNFEINDGKIYQSKLASFYPSIPAEELLAGILLANMKSPAQLGEILKGLQNPNQDFILGRFYEISNLIAEGKISATDLLPLYKRMPESQDKVRDAALGYAVFILLAMEKRAGNKDNPPKYDLKALYSAHNKIPTDNSKTLSPIKALQANELIKQIANKMIETPYPVMFGSEINNAPMNLRENNTRISAEVMRQILQEDPQVFGQYHEEALRILELETKNNSSIQPTQLLIRARAEFNRNINNSNDQQAAGADLLLDKAEAEISKRAALLENQLKTAPKTPSAIDRSIVSEQEKMVAFNNANVMENIKKNFMIKNEGAQVVIDNLEKGVKEYQALLEKGSDLEKADGAELLKGLEKAKSQLVEGQKKGAYIFDPKKLDELEAELITLKKGAQVQADGRKKEVLDNVKQMALKNELSPQILKAIDSAEKNVITQDELFEILINAYQRFELQKGGSATPKIAELEKRITQFLLFQTQAQQLGTPAEKLIANLKTIAAKDPFDQVTYNAISFNLSTVIERGNDLTRYLASDGSLANPQLSRKYLVLEYRSEPDKIILRPEQRELIQKAAANPDLFYELRMGLGKTSYILPTLFMIWAENGSLPVGLIKDELLLKNHKELDPSTRVMIEQAGIIYNFDTNALSDSAVLADQYLRLLEVKKNKGYVLTSVHSLASIEQKMVLLGLKREDLIGRILDKEDPGKFNEIFNEKLAQGNADCRELLNLQKQIYWISKTRALLNGNERELNFKTQKFADEADDLFSNIKEDNYALGDGKVNKIPIDMEVKEAALLIMKTLFSSNNPEVVKLREAIMNGSQSGINKQDLKDKYFPALANEILGSNGFSKQITAIGKEEKIKKLLESIPRDELINYICQRNAPIPEGMQAVEDPKEMDQFQKTVGLLKEMFQKTLPKSLGMQQDLDIGVKEKDGMTVGPRVRGQEEVGMVYSDQLDIISNHLVQFASKIPESAFFNKAVIEFSEKKVEFKELEARFEVYKVRNPKATFVEFLNQPENYKQRINLFELAVLDKDLLSRYARQVVVPVQDLATNNTGGMTGTLDDYIMPDTKNKRGVDDVPRVVEGEVYLRIAMQTEKPKVVIAKDEKSLLTDMAKSFAKDNCKFIISEGSALGGIDALQAIEQLRGTEDCKNLHFVFTFPKKEGDPRSRQAVVWSPNMDEPQLINRSEVSKLQKDNPNGVRFFFASTEYRGTDYGKVEKGSGIPITGTTTTTDSFGQAVYRERGLGVEHSVSDIVISSAQAERIMKDQGLKNPEDIQWTHVINDIRLQTRQQKDGRYLKSPTDKATSYLRLAARDINSIVTGAQEKSGYWSLNNPERVSDIQIQSQLFNLHKDILVLSKKLDYKTMFNPTNEIETKLKIDSLYEKSMADIETSRSQIMKLPESELRTKALEILDKVEGDLLVARGKFDRDFEAIHLNKLPPKTSSSGGDVASAHSIVSEQAQQAENVVASEQQQEQAQALEAAQEQSAVNMLERAGAGIYPKLDGYRGFDPADLDKLKDNRFNVSKSWNRANEFGIENMMLTPEMKSIVSNFSNDKSPGENVGYIALIGDQVVLMSKADYGWILSRELKNSQSEFNKKYGNQPITVLALAGGIGYENCKEKYLVIDQGQASHNLNANDVKLNIVKAKWMMGFSDFTREEIPLLKGWLFPQVNGWNIAALGAKMEFDNALQEFMSFRANAAQKEFFELLKRM